MKIFATILCSVILLSSIAVAIKTIAIGNVLEGVLFGSVGLLSLLVAWEFRHE